MAAICKMAASKPSCLNHVIAKKKKLPYIKDFPGGSDGKVSVYNEGDPGSIPGLGRSPREGNGNPLQYSCLGNPWTEEPGGLQFMRSEKSWA